MRKRILAFVTAVILLCCLPATASAASVDMNAKGSVTVTAVYNKVPLKDLKMNCIKVATLEFSNDSYYFDSIYDDSVFTLENIHDTKNPEAMLKLVKKGELVGVSAAADQNGLIKFTNLAPGMYLIYQTEKYTNAGNQYKIHEFLVTVPYEGKYDVNAESKPGLNLFPEDPPKPGTGTGTSNKVTRLPQTGQLTWPVPVLAISGMTFFILGWWLCFGRRKDPNEK